MNPVGTYSVKIDNKGRMRLPSKLLKVLSDGGTQGHFYVARGVGKCLTLFTEDLWARETNKLLKLDRTIASNVIMIRAFHHGASEVTIDSADRISLSSLQMNMAEIEDEIIITYFLDQVEIWSKKNYDNQQNLVIDNYALIREAAFHPERKIELKTEQNE